VPDGQDTIEAWRVGYNVTRPHGSVADRTPEKFANASSWPAAATPSAGLARGLHGNQLSHLDEGSRTNPKKPLPEQPGPPSKPDPLSVDNDPLSVDNLDERPVDGEQVNGGARATTDACSYTSVDSCI